MMCRIAFSEGPYSQWAVSLRCNFLISAQMHRILFFRCWWSSTVFVADLRHRTLLVTLLFEWICWHSLFFPVCSGPGFLWNVDRCIVCDMWACSEKEGRDLKLERDRFWVTIWRRRWSSLAWTLLERAKTMALKRCLKGWPVDWMRLV